jgi:hypothetical protein
MEQLSEFISVESFSLTPHRLSMYYTKIRRTPADDHTSKSMSASDKAKILANLHGGEYTPETRWHKFSISDQARKTMLLKINWLYFMAKSRYKKAISGKEIFNFKLNFITLTLSSKQVHPTAEITEKCFNQFLTEIRKMYKMENYVWRLEFQKNGNVHYHIVTDCYTDFHIVNKIWNRCQDKLGYVAAYTKKHITMSLNDYVREYEDNGKVSFEKLRYRYAKGKGSGWKIPNSTDVKSVSSGKQISFYIAKYFSKKENRNNACNPLDTKENSIGLRLWFCSRSLSKLSAIRDFVPAFKLDLLDLLYTAKDIFHVAHDFCKSWFYSISTLEAKAKGVISQLLRDYAIKLSYIPSS